MFDEPLSSPMRTSDEEDFQGCGKRVVNRFAGQFPSLGDFGQRIDGNSKDATGSRPQKVEPSGGGLGEHLFRQLEEMPVKAEEGIL